MDGQDKDPTVKSIIFISPIDKVGNLWYTTYIILEN